MQLAAHGALPLGMHCELPLLAVTAGQVNSESLCLWQYVRRFKKAEKSSQNSLILSSSKDLTQQSAQFQPNLLLIYLQFFGAGLNLDVLTALESCCWLAGPRFSYLLPVVSFWLYLPSPGKPMQLCFFLLVTQTVGKLWKKLQENKVFVFFFSSNADLSWIEYLEYISFKSNK